jgi:superfamily II DNA or RNA helicase
VTSSTTPPPSGFRDLDLKIHYEGPGEQILQEFVLPALQLSVSYDRLTSYFSVNSLLAISQGIEAIWKREGRMRLILGLHDVPWELAQASVARDDWATQVIKLVGDRLLDQVSSLRDEFSRDRIATLAWMMESGLLEVRVAAPSGPEVVDTARSVFHSKRFIFKDQSGALVSAVGSPNETVMGMGGNYEEVTVNMSWRDTEGYVRTHLQSFERLWKDERDDLTVRPLDPEFAKELLRRADRPPFPERESAQKKKPANRLAAELLDLARKSPSFALFNSGPAALYPHQERAFLDGLSRWPVRVLLADEVGLGKTLEAGAIISYLMRFGGVKRALLLVPAAVIRQWQEELTIHFGLECWRYESATRTFVSLNGDIRGLPSGESPVGSAAPNLTLVSAQLARGTREAGHIFADVTNLPDLLVVDEAHSARVKPDLDGTLRPTLMWRMLDDVAPRVKHLVLASATPVQVHWAEHHALLSLLGLPSAWDEPQNYERALALLSKESTAGSLQDAKIALTLIHSSLREHRLSLEANNERAARILAGCNGEDPPTVSDVIFAKEHWRETYELLIKAHPSSYLTVRNSRSGLERMGYRFPKRELSAPDLEVTAEVEAFYGSVEEYLKDAYGLVEEAAFPDRNLNLGFAKSNFHQRLASSLYAAGISLRNRLRKFEALVNATTSYSTGPDESAELEDEDSSLPEGAPTAGVERERLDYAIGLERAYIDDLLKRVDSIGTEEWHQGDPKLKGLMQILGRHLGIDQALVFSRYTDTLDACVEAFLEYSGSQEVPGHATYTGGQCWIDLGDGRQPATKQVVKGALDRGEIHVVFCSEAASEGLNLQSARVLINVDVPWNPARLEQRIGRIARLGQKASTVDIYNLWYPDSVEAKMYSRLLQRRELYQLAVGEFPELFSRAIRDEVTARFSELSLPGVDPFAVLQRVRADAQQEALKRVWDVNVEDDAASFSFRKDLLALVAETLSRSSIEYETNGPVAVADDLSASPHPGGDDAITLLHPLMGHLVNSPQAEEMVAQKVEVAALLRGGVPFGFCLKNGEEIGVLLAEDFPRLLGAAVRGRLGKGLEVTKVKNVDDLPDYRESFGRWLPDPSALDLRTFGDRSAEPPLSDPLAWELQVLGTVSIDG